MNRSHVGMRPGLTSLGVLSTPLGRCSSGPDQPLVLFRVPIAILFAPIHLAEMLRRRCGVNWGWADFALGLLPAARTVLAGIDAYQANSGFSSPPWILCPVFILLTLPDAMAIMLRPLIIIDALLASLYETASTFRIPTRRTRLLFVLVLVMTHLSGAEDRKLFNQFKDLCLEPVYLDDQLYAIYEIDYQ